MIHTAHVERVCKLLYVLFLSIFFAFVHFTGQVGVVGGEN